MLMLGSPQERPEAAAEVATGFLFKTITVGEEEYAYSVYVPPEYTAEKRWPLILFLHGSGERGTDGLQQTEIGIGRAIRRRRAWIPAIVVMPQCRPGAAWTGKMAEMALRCVEQTSREYAIDPERLYLTGLSLGGHGTWLIGAQYAHQFAALVPICGFIELGPSSGAVKEIAPHLTDIPIWCFHGGADTNVPPEKSREVVAAVRAAGGEVKYTEYPGVAHNSWDRAYDERALWEWLFAQRRQATGQEGNEQKTGNEGGAGNGK